MTGELCAHCGAERRGDLQVCVRCETPFPGGDSVVQPGARPAKPSPTQSHGTVLVAMLGGMVVLAVLLGLSVRGVGPFEAKVVATEPRGADKVAVTVQVTNKGAKAGHGRCSVTRLRTGTGDRAPSYQFLSDRVPGRTTITQQVEVPVDSGVTTNGQITC